MTRRPFSTRCLCGLRTVLHFRKGVKLSCDEARLLHPRATVVRHKLTTLLRKAVA